MADFIKVGRATREAHISLLERVARKSQNELHQTIVAYHAWQNSSLYDKTIGRVSDWFTGHKRDVPSRKEYDLTRARYFGLEGHSS